MMALVACEESQAVTSQLRRVGVNAFSCDLLPTSGRHPEWHIQADALEVAKLDWDLIIAFPPCTNLAVSGAAWFEQKRKDGRQFMGMGFFLAFTKLSCKHIAIENPVGIMSSNYRKPDQIIQPYMFGDPYEKKTCLWLKGLPKLVPINEVEPEPRTVYKSGRSMPTWYAQAWSLSPHDRSVARSKTFPGIAKAMAKQWGSYVMDEIEVPE